MGQIFTGMSQTNEWEERDRFIAGSTHLFGKRRQLYCENWPSSYFKAKGAYIWVSRWKKYIDLTMNGVGCSVLGYAPNQVINSVKKVADLCNLTTINSYEEVELAELLVSLHPWAEMARFSRTGGEMASIAIRIARSSSGRNRVLVYGYHGWSDWYLAASIKDKNALDSFLLPEIPSKGIPDELGSYTTALKSLTLDSVAQECSNDELPGVLIIEIGRKELANINELQSIMDYCKKKSILVIFDEITSGFRECLGGMHLKYNVKPDAVLYGKTISSGFPFSALVGTSSFFSGFSKTFISSVYWTDRTGPAAALATLKHMKRLEKSLFNHLYYVGNMFKDSLIGICSDYDITVSASEVPSLLSFDFPEYKDSGLQTYLTQQLLAKNILFSNRFYPTYAHKKKHVNRFKQCLGEILEPLGKSPEPSAVSARVVGKLRSISLE